MNKKAKKLNMNNTNFEDCCGHCTCGCDDDCCCDGDCHCKEDNEK